MTTPTLSICMIVRNAEDVLERCLDSIKGIYDELCIVDTGSTDNTAEIACRHANTFSTYDACNDSDGRIIDFSRARNHCIAMAKGNWILSIDADEKFTNNSGQSIQNLLKDRSETAVAITISRSQTYWVAIRLFKNIPDQYYHHAVHELVHVSGEVLTLRELSIKDMGQKNKPEASAQRNERICNYLLHINPNDLRALFYRAEAQRKQSKYLGAANDFLSCLDHEHLSTPYRCATLEALAACFMHLGRWQEAKDSASMVIQLHPGLAESYCLMGDACLALHQIHQAKNCYLKAAAQNYPPEDYHLFVRKDFYHNYPMGQLNELKSLCHKHGLNYELL